MILLNIQYKQELIDNVYDSVIREIQMKFREISDKYHISISEIKNTVQNHPDIPVSGLFQDTVDDSYVPDLVAYYKVDLAEANAKAIQKEQEEKEKLEKELDKQKALASILVTSGFSFDGYTITKYSGYISGDDAKQIDRKYLFLNDGHYLTDLLVKIRIQALKELKEAAYDLGCNAVIGVDYDYLTFEPENGAGDKHYYEPYVICVTANGNAVVIEKK